MCQLQQAAVLMRDVLYSSREDMYPSNPLLERGSNPPPLLTVIAHRHRGGVVVQAVQGERAQPAPLADTVLRVMREESKEG